MYKLRRPHGSSFYGSTGPKRRPKYRSKRPWWLPSRIGGNEIFLGALMLPIFAVAKFVTDESFGLHDALKLLGVAALLAMLGIGLHVLFKVVGRQIRQRR